MLEIMKTTHIHTLILIVLTAFVLYNSFVNGGTVHRARQLTESMEVQLDSLHVIYKNYQQLHQIYEGIYKDLVISQHRANDLNAKLTKISTSQQADVTHIRQELRQLLTSYDTLQLEAIASHPQSDFQP